MQCNPSPDEILYAQFIEAALELFGFYSTDKPVHQELGRQDLRSFYRTQQAADQIPDDWVSSIVGITANDFRCSIGLLSTPQTTCCLAGDSPDCPVDWLGELSNQLAGRIKNRLTVYGVTANLGMPVSTRGKHLHFFTRSNENGLHRFHMSVGDIFAILLCSFKPNVKWHALSESTTIEEGSMMFLSDSL